MFGLVTGTGVPDGRAPGEPHGVGCHPLAAQVHRHILRLDADRHLLGQPPQALVHRPGRHRNRVLNTDNIGLTEN
jgi:hypothetical protein